MKAFVAKKWEKEEAVQWAIAPEHSRVPRTVEEKAMSLNVTPVTLYRWLAEPEVQDVIRRERAKQLSRYDHAVFKAMADSAQILGREGHADRVLFLKLRGYDPDSLSVKHEVEHKIDSTILPDDALSKVLAIQMAEKMVERFGVDMEDARIVMEENFSESLAPREVVGLDRLGLVDGEG
jgi:hypothetical protein